MLNSLHLATQPLTSLSLHTTTTTGTQGSVPVHENSNTPLAGLSCIKDRCIKTCSACATGAHLQLPVKAP